MKGGARKGAGRKKGGQNQRPREVRALLNLNKLNLVKKAIDIALKGDRVMLAKLLDKILPSLNENINFNFEDWLRDKQKEIKSGEYGL